MFSAQSVNFGPRRTGLSTVGYALYNPNGTVKQTRTTEGITEIGSTGIYTCLMSLDDIWQGVIIWDTGEVVPLYAAEQFDYRNLSEGGGYVVFGNPSWSAQEKEKLFKLLELQIDKTLQDNKKLDKIYEDLTMIGEALTALFEKIDLDDLKKKIEETVDV